MRLLLSKVQKMFFWWNNTIDFSPEYVEEVDADEFIRIYNTELDNIQWVRVVPARLGHGFGKILVRRKNPLYKYMRGPVVATQGEGYEPIAG
jgi:hypothetical protein